MYPQAVLSFTLPSGEKRAVSLTPNEMILIGRNRASTIKLNLPSVSRSHARIIYDREVFWIEDLGSSNGTFVNQKQVQKARINIGDVLKCGDFVIAVRNSSDRSSIPPPLSASNHDAHSTPVAGLDHKTSIGKRRESLPPSSRNSSSSHPSPWHSKAPTHGPEESDQLPAARLQKGERLSSPVKHTPPSQHPRSEGLSTAFSNAKIRESDRLREKNSLQPAQVDDQSPGESPFNQTSEEDNTELMRLRIVEKQLIDEVNFQSNSIDQLKLQVQDYQERIMSLESELDHGAQQFEELRRSVMDADQSKENELNRSHQEVESLQTDILNLERMLTEQAERFSSQESDFSREIELLEEEKRELKLAIDRYTEHSQDDRLEEAINQLRAENERLSAEIKAPRGSTEIHVYSLPRPHYESTQPNWAKHQAKYQQLLDELKYLKRRNAELENDQVRQSSASPTHEVTSLLQPPSISHVAPLDEETSMSEVDISESRSHDSNIPSHSGSSSASPTPTRRAWRGLL